MDVRLLAGDRSDPGVAMTALKTILFFILVPFLCIGMVPLYLVMTERPLFSFGAFRWVALLFWLFGWMVLIWCCRDFIVWGHGTPNPLDPPRELVVKGLYRVARNPMYIGATAVLVGWVFWSPSLPILLMPVICFTASYLFVVFYEEPHLRKTFGGVYDAYCQSVPRWLPPVDKKPAP